MMSRFYAAVREPVERHGGIVEKVIGDALVAVFGIPMVHEDDALRAVRAALEMRDAVREMGEIQARIGVNTGDVLARDPTQGESLVVGDAVNVAARLEQAAAARRRPGRRGDVGARRACSARGAAGADRGQGQARAAHGLAARERSIRRRRSHRRRLDLPMVGREPSSDLLRWALERTSRGEPAAPGHPARAAGHRQVTARRRAAPARATGSRLLIGQCRATTVSSSLEPLVEVVRAAIPTARHRGGGRSPHAGRPGRGGGRRVPCTAGAPAAPDVAWARLAPDRRDGRDADRGVVLEDVHWAERACCSTSSSSCSGTAAAGALLVVCTARPELAGPAAGAGDRGRTRAPSSLERLDDAADEAPAHATPARTARGRAGRAVSQAAEGNPLFAEHLAALVGDDAHVGRAASVDPGAAGGAAGGAARTGARGGRRRGGRRAGLPGGRSRGAGRPAGRRPSSTASRTASWSSRRLRAGSGSATPSCRMRPTACSRSSAAASCTCGSLAGSTATGGDDAVGRRPPRTGLPASGGARHRGRDDRAAGRGGRRAAGGGRPQRRHDGRSAAARASPRAGARTCSRSASPERAAAMVELAAAGWNLLPHGMSCSRLLDDGAELAAELGVRAVELRARVLRLGAVRGRTPTSSRSAM